MRSSAILRSVEWYFCTDVSGQTIGPTFKGQELLEKLCPIFFQYPNNIFIIEVDSNCACAHIIDAHAHKRRALLRMGVVEEQGREYSFMRALTRVALHTESS
jgi:hypothetical protein